MGQADDIREAILGAVKAPKEVKELKETIRSALEFLNKHGRQSIEQLVTDQGTPDEQVRQGWIIKDGLPYYQKWLDSTGTLWTLHFDDGLITQRVDLVALPGLIVSMHTRDIKVFLEDFAP